MSTFDTVDEFIATRESMTDAEISNFDADLLISAPATVTPDSAEEYIYGCLTEQSNSLNMCVPSCINGYKPSGISECSMSVYHRKDGKIVRINKKSKSSKGYLYIDSDDEEDLSKSEIKRLNTQDNIKELYLYKKQKDSSEYEHIDTLIFHKDETPADNTWDRIVLIFFVILILFIIFIVIYIVYNTFYGKCSNAAPLNTRSIY